ncbi:hypothetical protein KUCAC02_014195, partial [Chaenocephalus aceratus]
VELLALTCDTELFPTCFLRIPLCSRVWQMSNVTGRGMKGGMGGRRWESSCQGDLSPGHQLALGLQCVTVKGQCSGQWRANYSVLYSHSTLPPREQCLQESY